MKGQVQGLETGLTIELRPQAWRAAFAIVRASLPSDWAQLRERRCSSANGTLAAPFGAAQALTWRERGANQAESIRSPASQWTEQAQHRDQRLNQHGFRVPSQFVRTFAPIYALL